MGYRGTPSNSKICPKNFPRFSQFEKLESIVWNTLEIRLPKPLSRLKLSRPNRAGFYIFVPSDFSAHTCAEI